MTARDALAAIQERAATARVRATEDEADLARWPTRLMSQSQHDRRLLARDNVRLVGALEAVLDWLHEVVDEKPDYDRMQGYEIHQHDGRVEMARGLLEEIDEKLEGR